MTEREGFLSRWSRLKRDNAQATDKKASPEETIENSDGEGTAKDKTDRAIASEGGIEMMSASSDVDLSKLPPIDSIAATTDIRGFLAPGVPEELRRAALRRAWIADPKVRTFVGIAENQWDFTDPETVPGFGPLKTVDDVARLVADVLRDSRAQEQSVQHVAAELEPTQPITAAEVKQAGREEDFGATTAGEPTASEDPAAIASDHVRQVGVVASHKRDPKPDTSSRPRRHGGALPE